MCIICDISICFHKPVRLRHLRQANRPHPDLQLDPLVVAIHRFHFEVNAHGADEGVAEGVVGVAEQEGRLPHAAVADDQQLEHVVEVLVRAIPLAETLVCLCHLKI